MTIKWKELKLFGININNKMLICSSLFWSYYDMILSFILLKFIIYNKR